jgi:hypothetical protein
LQKSKKEFYKIAQNISFIHLTNDAATISLRHFKISFC